MCVFLYGDLLVFVIANKTMSSEEQEQQQPQQKTTSTTTTSSQQQEGSVTPATSAVKNSVKRVSIKGTPSRVKIAAPYAYVEVIQLYWCCFGMCMRESFRGEEITVYPNQFQRFVGI